MIRAAFFDLDGTLYSHSLRAIPPGVRRALGLLRRRGVELYLATGRHPEELGGLPLDGLGFSGAIFLNGQLALDRLGRVLFSCPMEDGALEALLELFHGLGRPLLLACREAFHLTMEAPQALEKRLKGYSQPQVGGCDGRDIYQATVFQAPEEDPRLLELLPPGLRLVRWSGFGADLISQRGGKGPAMERILQLQGLSPQQAIAFGDADNDRDMLTLAAKAAADYVAGHIDQEGLERALYELGIL